jgi:hypothetical protein
VSGPACGCVAGPCGTPKQSAVFSLPDVNDTAHAADAASKSAVNALGAEYLGCYTGYSGWEASDPLFAAHLMIASPPPPVAVAHAASDFYQRSGQLQNARQAPGASLGASEPYDPRSDAHDARFLGDLLETFAPTEDELGSSHVAIGRPWRHTLCLLAVHVYTLGAFASMTWTLVSWMFARSALTLATSFSLHLPFVPFFGQLLAISCLTLNCARVSELTTPDCLTAVSAKPVTLTSIL